VFINIVSSESIMQPSKTVSSEVIFSHFECINVDEILNGLCKFDFILLTEVCVINTSFIIRDTAIVSFGCALILEFKIVYCYEYFLVYVIYFTIMRPSSLLKRISIAYHYTQLLRTHSLLYSTLLSTAGSSSTCNTILNQFCTI
jgi:hypothetical protein